jgi:hypothetical protein
LSTARIANSFERMIRRVESGEILPRWRNQKAYQELTAQLGKGETGKPNGWMEKREMGSNGSEPTHQILLPIPRSTA